MARGPARHRLRHAPMHPTCRHAQPLHGLDRGADAQADVQGAGAVGAQQGSGLLQVEGTIHCAADSSGGAGGAQQGVRAGEGAQHMEREYRSSVLLAAPLTTLHCHCCTWLLKLGTGLHPGGHPCSPCFPCSIYVSMHGRSPDWPATSGGATYSPPMMLWSKRSRRYLRHRLGMAQGNRVVVCELPQQGKQVESGAGIALCESNLAMRQGPGVG